MTAGAVARAAAPRLAREGRHVGAADLAWVAARVVAEREAQHPELRRLDAAARLAVWQSWQADLVALVMHRARAL